MALSYTQAVRKGAELLDQKSPGWAYKVNMTRLDMSCTYDCVLGQVYGEYFDGTEALLLNGRDDRRPTANMGARNGFAVPYGTWHREASRFARLDELWKDQIRSRRGRSGTRARPWRAPIRQFRARPTWGTTVNRGHAEDW